MRGIVPSPPGEAWRWRRIWRSNTGGNQMNQKLWDTSRSVFHNSFQLILKSKALCEEKMDAQMRELEERHQSQVEAVARGFSAVGFGHSHFWLHKTGSILLVGSKVVKPGGGIDTAVWTQLRSVSQKFVSELLRLPMDRILDYLLLRFTPNKS